VGRDAEVIVVVSNIEEILIYFLVRGRVTRILGSTKTDRKSEDFVPNLGARSVKGPSIIKCAHLGE